MNSLQDELRTLYMRELDQLITNLEKTPEKLLWESPDGVTNSCGVLVQHLVGNLNHFIGAGFGKTGYVRNRDHEFTVAKTSKEELLESIQALKQTLAPIFNDLSENDLNQEYPINTPLEASSRQFLIHLYGHLNYHLGQLNYLRRILSADPTYRQNDSKNG